MTNNNSPVRGAVTANGVPVGWTPVASPRGAERRCRDYAYLSEISLFSAPLPPLLTQQPRRRSGIRPPSPMQGSRGAHQDTCGSGCPGPGGTTIDSLYGLCASMAGGSGGGPQGRALSDSESSGTAGCRAIGGGGSGSSSCRDGTSANSTPYYGTPRAQLAGGNYHTDSLNGVRRGLQSFWRHFSSSIGAATQIWCGTDQEWCGLSDGPPGSEPRSRMAPHHQRHLETVDVAVPMDFLTWSLRSSPPMDAGAQSGGTPSHIVGIRPEDDLPPARVVQPLGFPPQAAPMVNMGGNFPSPDISRRGMDKPMGQREIYRALVENRASLCSLKGNKASSPNQDRALCSSLGTGAAQVFGVFDGHGEQGHLCAEIVALVLPKLVLHAVHRCCSRGAPGGCYEGSPRGQHLRLRDDAQNPQEAAGVGLVSGTAPTGANLTEAREAVSRAFEEMHEILEALTIQSMSLLEDKPAIKDALSIVPSSLGTVDARVSGTTATIVCFMPGRGCLAAHVGDSRAVLGIRRAGAVEDCRIHGTPWRVTELTRDHKPTLPMERERIEEAGAQVVTVGMAPNVAHRVYTPRQPWPAINMSRSIGDLHAHMQGLSASAEVRVVDSMWDPSTDEALVVIGSDGIWDVIDPETAVEVASAHCRGDPAAALAHEAYERWAARGLQGNYSDDITAVVKFL